MQLRECRNLPFQMIVKYPHPDQPKLKYFDGVHFYFGEILQSETQVENLRISLRLDGDFKPYNYRILRTDKGIVGISLQLEIKEKIKIIQALSMAQCS